MATNNYVCVVRGRDPARYVFFDDLDRNAVLRAVDQISRILSEYGSSLNAVRAGRNGIIEAMIFRPCSTIPLPAVGEVPRSQRRLDS